MSASLLSRVTSTAQALPSRVFLYAREKWGKSSLFAHAPGAVFFMTRGETGLVELISGGRVPPTAHFPYDEQQPPAWSTLRQAVRELQAEEHSYKFLVIDTCNGAEILCQEHVRNGEFRGNQKAFTAYGKGWDACRIEWLGLLQDLDALRARRKMAVVLLAHTQVKKFDDPTAEESYDKYRPACQDKLWDLTHKWADIICFGHFEAQTYETDSGKTKARSQTNRVLCFDQSPLWEAGNRYGVAGKLNVGDGAKAAFAAFAQLVAKAKSSQQPQPPSGHGKPAAASAPPPPPAPTPGHEPPTGTPPDAEPDGDQGDTKEHDPLPAGGSGATKIGGDLVQKIIKLLGDETGIDWPSVREGKGAAEGVPALCGFAPNPNLKVGQLAPEPGLKLHAWLKGKQAEKDARRRNPRPEPAGVQ